jgi:hypothetical protein
MIPVPIKHTMIPVPIKHTMTLDCWLHPAGLLASPEQLMKQFRFN